jgi:hypothetical protein
VSLVKLIITTFVHGFLGWLIGAGLGMFILAPVAIRHEFIGQFLGNSNKEILFTSSFYSSLLGLFLAAIVPILNWRKSKETQKNA